MIRFLFLLIVFCVGLAAAGLWFGQVHHVRMAVPDAFPGWTEAIPDDAGLRGGTYSLPSQGIWPPVEVTWQAVAPGLDGLHWRVQATGNGVDLAGNLTVWFWPDSARLDNLTGTIALDAVSEGAVGLDGLLALRDGSVDVRGLLEMPVLSGAMSGDLRGVRAGGAEFGDGPVSAVLNEGGGWRIRSQLSGGVSPVDASLTGDVAERTATLDAAVSRDQGLPTGLREVLSRFGERDGEGWAVTAQIPVY